jgi:hypothetical protein
LEVKLTELLGYQRYKRSTNKSTMTCNRYLSQQELISVLCNDSSKTETLKTHDLETFLQLQLQNRKKSYFALCSSTNILVYDLNTITVAYTVPKDKRTHSIDFLSEHELVISTTPKVIIWDLNHNSTTSTLEFHPEEFETSWVLSAKSRVLFCSTIKVPEKRLNLWNVRTNKVVKSNTFYSAINEALERNNMIITCNNSGQLNIWNMSLEKIRDILVTDRFIYSIDFYDKDSVLLGIDTGVICYNFKLKTRKDIKGADRVHMVRKGYKRNTIVYFFHEYYSIPDEHDDGDYFIIQVYDTATKKDLFTSFWGTHNGSFIQNGSRLLHCRNGELTVVDTETMQEIKNIQGEFDSSIRLCAWDARKELELADSQIEFSDSAKTDSSGCLLS